ncbi:MAG: prepilin-type N-terminal cleavage/methylation domain-containing protein [Terrimicrobiaceae bacterium]|nr:prepilin-type N-terminal cleavage/methylation domain-containing protein [Terrimicrobiaceae bacterium]
MRSQLVAAATFRAGLSLVEVVIVIGVIGIMAAIGVPVISNLFRSTGGEVAQRNLNLLNGAVRAFSQANWELAVDPGADTDDEQAVYQSLRYRNPANPSPGSPYLEANVNFVTSMTADSFRARWNGNVFEMLLPGQEGEGIDLLEMMGTAGPAYLTNNPVPPQ